MYIYTVYISTYAKDQSNFIQNLFKKLQPQYECITSVLAFTIF